MRTRRRATCLAVCCAAALAVTTPSSADVFNMPASDVSLQFVTVGDAGNPADSNPGTHPFGVVGYAYQMGVYDVTNAQYCQFLNAVAHSDPYGLYSSSAVGSAIGRDGSSGSYTYSVIPGDENYPVVYVSEGDAARFCNWLYNGQPATGSETAATTESGSYPMDGATGLEEGLVPHSASATFVLPTVNEWYKAAYYKGGSLNAGYWIYPTQSDIAPSNIISATGTNNANFYSGSGPDNGGPTPVGTFADSPGPYGTYDMGGDVFQWTDATGRDLLYTMGGSSFYTIDYLATTGEVTGAYGYDDSLGDDGFRVVDLAAAPEPAAVPPILLLWPVLASVRYRARRYRVL